MATGDLIKLGTLYKAGTKQLNPTDPDRYGNIPGFSSGQSLEIRDTDSSDAYKVKWREVNVGSKKLLIADRNIVNEISWDDLNAQDLIFGKEIKIDGQDYLLRALTGGEEKRGGGTGSSYDGGKLPNEWDDIIVNEGGYSGLPNPTTADLDGLNASGAHNQFWHWDYIYSWCQETYLHNSSFRVIRGDRSARYWHYYASSDRNTGCGWRPVLEVLNSAPLISGDSQNQGNKSTPFTISYQVSDPEGDAVDIVEKLNGATINSESDIEQGVDRELEITINQWASLPLNVESTITIEATDSKGARSTREYTFTKTNSAPTVTITDPTGDLSDIGIVDTLTPVFVHRFDDIDPNDKQSAYQYIISDLQEEVIHDSGKKISTQSYYQTPDEVLNWGDRVKVQVKVWDKYDLSSDLSFPVFIMPNRPPNVTNLQPGSDDKENPQEAGQEPIFTWEFEDLDLESQVAYQLKVYQTSDDMLVYDSGKVRRNTQEHQVTSVLETGTEYYATLEAWDPNDLSGTTDKVYIRTNATPSAPIQSSPIDNYRTPLTPTFKGIIGTDPEDDGMHFAIEIDRSEDFDKNPVILQSDKDRTGWLVSGLEIPENGVKNDQEGQQVTYTLQFDLDMNRTYYWRVAAVDAKTKAIGNWSNSRKIRAGNELEFKTSTPVVTGAEAARRMLFAADYFIASDGSNPAVLSVEYTNNALDIEPTWEDATEAFKNMDYHNFVNDEKAASDFAVGARYKVEANDSMEPIYVDAIGLTFD